MQNGIRKEIVRVVIATLIVVVVTTVMICLFFSSTEAQEPNFQVEGWATFGNEISPTIHISGTVQTSRPGVWLVLNHHGDEFVVMYTAQQNVREVPVTATFYGGAVDILDSSYPVMGFTWNTQYCFQVYEGSEYSYDPIFYNELGEVCVTTPGEPKYKSYLPLVATSH